MRWIQIASEEKKVEISDAVKCAPESVMRLKMRLTKKYSELYYVQHGHLPHPAHPKEEHVIILLYFLNIGVIKIPPIQMTLLRKHRKD